MADDLERPPAGNIEERPNGTARPRSTNGAARGTVRECADAMTVRTFLALAFVVAGAIACSTASNADNDDPSAEDDDDKDSDDDDDNGGSSGPSGGAATDTPDSGSTTPAAEGGASSTTCQSPRVLGSVKGDVVGTSVTAKGTCSEWLQVRATEDSSGGDRMKMKVTLVPDSTIDFDLYVYLGTDAIQVECATPTAQSTQSGTSLDVAKLEWGENGIPNGNDDDRTVSIEVRAKDPSDCTPTTSDGGGGPSKWTLLVEGNVAE